MNDRERLIELLDDALAVYDVIVYALLHTDEIADLIIANGVTVQKHGRWIKTGIMEPGYDYSECGQSYAWWNCSEAHYCPNCGARMDLEDGDGEE